MAQIESREPSLLPTSREDRWRGTTSRRCRFSFLLLPAFSDFHYYFSSFVSIRVCPYAGIPAGLLNHGFQAVYLCAAAICLLGLIFTILTAREEGRSAAGEAGRL